MTLYALAQHTPQFGENCWIADNASVIGQVRAGRDVSVWFNAVLRGDNDLITIGDGCNIQDSAILHTDAGVPLTMGAHITVGHQAMLHGCTIGDGCLIGIGAVVLNAATIGESCLIGAGTLIPEGKTIAPRSLVVGTPGRVIRTLSDEEVAGLRKNAAEYVQNAQYFARHLRPLATPDEAAGGGNEQDK